MQLPVKKLSSGGDPTIGVLQEEDGKYVEIPSPERAIIY
jgi:hypothetical protein